MRYRFGIWSEADKEVVTSSRSLSMVMRVWDEQGCSYPSEKLIMLDSEGAEDAARKRVILLDITEETMLIMIGELEMLEKEGLEGFRVNRLW